MLRVLLFLLFALPAQAGEQTPPPRILLPDEYAAGVAQFDYAAHTVNLERFQELAAGENVVVIDLRSRAAYDNGHYEGAKWLGPDITEQALAAIAPDKSATLLFYCMNSLMPTRMISLTDVALPQAKAFGYQSLYKLGPVWQEDGRMSEEHLTLFSK